MSSDPLPAESSPAPNKVREQLLPPAFFSPLNLLWICVLPLILLLFINTQAIWLCYGEITDESSRQSAQWVLLANGAMTLGLGVMSLLLRKAGKVLHTGWFLLLMGLHAAFIWFDFDALGKALPSSVPDWILSRDTLMLSQLACIMPGSFYSLLGFACFPSRLSKGKDMLLSGALLVGVPLIWYLLVQMVSFLGSSHSPSVYVAVPFFILSTALMFIGLLRLLIRLHTWMRAYQVVLVLITALAFPLGGLLLNRSIPFPVNFQVTGIYVLTVLNGLALLAGSLPRLRQNPWIILTQVLTFPFTLYFFVIFLPFLPLFVPAMIVMGAGFLVLTPTVLFMVHGQRLLEGFFCLAEKRGKLRVALAFAAMLVLLPCWFAGQAFLDRATLHQGLDFIYTPKLYPRENFSGSPERMGRVLKNLVDFKEGQYLPILSDLYNRVVFDNLFLPDTKMEEMHQAFLGTPLPKAQQDRMADFSIWGGTSNRRSRSEPRMRPMQLPRAQAVIQSVETGRVEDGDCVRYTSVIRIKNNASVQNEFVATIDLPDGVLVSNYWLHIGKERVPGKLFEKKTALWVYEQIRDRTRRDPGILRYIAPNKLELRVFPLEAGEVRTTEIEFLYPKGLKPFGHIQSYGIVRPIYESASTPFDPYVIRFPGGAAILFGSNPQALPRIKQEAYIHFIVDHSLAGINNPKKLAASLRKIGSSPSLARMRECKITLANFESRLLQKDAAPLDQLENVLTTARLNSFEPKGGFLPEKAVKEEILAYEATLDEKNPATFAKFPFFVVVGPEITDHASVSDDLGRFLLEGDYPLETYRSSGSSRLTFLPEAISGEPLRWVTMGASGGKIFILRFSHGASWIKYIEAADKVSVYDPASGFAPLKLETLDNPTYIKGIQAHALERTLRQSPSLRPSQLINLVKQSKESGILVPATSYIVVENSAQWKILQLKEKQKLAGHEVMELQEASEPSWLILALLFAALAWFRTRFFPRKAEGLP